MVTIKRKFVTVIEWKVDCDDICWTAHDCWRVICNPNKWDEVEFKKFVRENIRHIVNMSEISRRLGFSYEDIVGEYDDELTNLAMEENDFFSKKFEDYGVNKYFEAKIKKEFGL